MMMYFHFYYLCDAFIVSSDARNKQQQNQSKYTSAF